MTKLNRRGFISSLIALPFVGRIIPKVASPAVPSLGVPGLSSVGTLRSGRALQLLMEHHDRIMIEKYNTIIQNTNQRLMAEWEIDREFFSGDQWPDYVRKQR